MKIAFTSCIDVLDDDVQTVWNRVRQLQPDVMVLLGDSIYMDFGKAFFPWFSDHPLNAPREWDGQRFLDEMYRRYAAQARVASFRELLSSVPSVGAIWDDHDFAWNNSCGAGQGDNVVPSDKKRIARGLLLQFREWVRSRPLPSAYPAKPSIETLLAGPDTGIEEIFDLDSVRFIMLDGRYYREPKTDDESSMMLGTAQRQWLSEQLRDWPGISVIGSGTTLSRSKESWDEYSDLPWLAQQPLQRAILLSGDIHRNASRKHKDLGDLMEFSASGAARPKLGGGSDNFGLLDITGNTVRATLFDEDGIEKEKTFQLPV